MSMRRSPPAQPVDYRAFRQPQSVPVSAGSGRPNRPVRRPRRRTRKGGQQAQDQVGQARLAWPACDGPCVVLCAPLRSADRASGDRVFPGAWPPRSRRCRRSAKGWVVPRKHRCPRHQKRQHHQHDKGRRDPDERGHRDLQPSLDVLSSAAALAPMTAVPPASATACATEVMAPFTASTRAPFASMMIAPSGLDAAARHPRRRRCRPWRPRPLHLRPRRSRSHS